ncbi:MAG: tRNA (adenosine(37)-N6)-dimethylallyltransferase MiaA, partial [Verrucomicrobiota bacterium]|nr:tRNA (adenosine(37)-N6)-dimethylallyltransferase MiaA [Verrucomicrobiota bacterium]
MSARAFYIVGPTAVGKSEIAAEVARRIGGEIVSADAFQVYAGLDLLTAKPEAGTLRIVPHHLIGTVSLTEEMNAERFRREALTAMESIERPIVVGGSGLYVRALTDGLSPLPAADDAIRAQLEQCTERELFIRLERLDPATAATIDRENKRRLIRALEICLVTHRPASELRQTKPNRTARGVLLFREREELQRRINERVVRMFADGVVEEVRQLGEVSETAAKTLGLAQVRELLAGRIFEHE